MRNLVLIGMPGTGKSTVGVLLAKRLGMRFIDTDLMLIERAGETLPKLLASRGVGGFLALEGKVGESLRCERTVIATGGSMVYSDEAMQNLKAQGLIVWLDTPLDMLKQRIVANADRGIAAAPGVTLESIEAERRPLYKRYADLRLEADDGIENVIANVLKALQDSRLGFTDSTGEIEKR